MIIDYVRRCIVAADELEGDWLYRLGFYAKPKPTYWPYSEAVWDAFTAGKFPQQQRQKQLTADGNPNDDAMVFRAGEFLGYWR